MTLTSAETPWSSFTRPDGITVIKDFSGNEIGQMNDPRDADEVVRKVNGVKTLFGGNR